ncbi:glycerate kinase [Subtercola vilae]|uniref:Glycerate kinase n=1 Tax=Subtercola vilae TaxID=2056433 RepID=A0A4T2BLN3_9MICO|nr:glycerate kinase [Subtercola vilae]TIH30246.1 glycerate kinase [Subtercola vilae]
MSPSLNVVVAPDSFKGSATAAEVARAIAGGWSEVRPGDTVVERPMADGGEGTIDAFAAAEPRAVRVPVTVTGPDDHPVTAEWLWIPGPEVDADEPVDEIAAALTRGRSGGTGVVELANTSGITLLDGLRPLDAHTIGFGQAIAAALDHGVEKLLLAIGGSSSTDGGAGALTALGARFLTAEGEPVAPGGRGLADVASVDFTLLRRPPVGGAIVVTDVTNGLLGSAGAAAVFGPQKGASPSDVGELDAALASFASIVGMLPTDSPAAAAIVVSSGIGSEASGDEASHRGRSFAQIEGAGAAGGTGFGLLIWGASIRPGAAAVGEALGLAADIEAADVVITGEGTFDFQSAAGKVPSYVLGLAHRFETFPLLVAGSIGASPDEFAASVSLTELAGSTAAAIENPLPFLWAAGRVLANGSARTPPQ